MSDYSYSDRADALIRSVYGTPPSDEDSIRLFDMAVSVQADYMSQYDGIDGFEKITLGDFSASMSDSSSDRRLISEEAAALLDSIYGGIRNPLIKA